jgi:phosphate transport system substrate-binding protein
MFHVKGFHAALGLICLSLVAVFGSCKGGGGANGGPVKMQGAGSSFVNPLFQKWMSEYGKLNPNIQMDYQPIGSGGGIKQIQEQTIDFGASDTAMKDDDLKSAAGPIIHIPVVLGAVVITYTCLRLAKPLQFFRKLSPIFIWERLRNG